MPYYNQTTVSTGTFAYQLPTGTSISPGDIFVIVHNPTGTPQMQQIPYSILQGTFQPSGSISTANFITGSWTQLQGGFQPSGTYTSPAHIDGLNISYVSSGTLSVQPGSAFVPSLGRMVFVTGSINVNIPLVSTTVSGSWQHVYLSEVGGVASVQVTGTAVDNPYAGVARTKSGDTSRRYIGSVYCDPNGQLYRWNSNVQGNIWRLNWLEAVNAYPFQFANVSGTVTTSTALPVPWLVPPTNGLVIEFMVQTVHNLVTAGDNVMSISDGSDSSTSSIISEALTRMTNGAAATTNIQLASVPIKITANTLKYTHQNVAGTNGGFFRARGVNIQR